MKRSKEIKLAIISWGILLCVIYFLIQSANNDHLILEKQGIPTRGEFIGFGSKNSVKWKYTTNKGSKIIIDKNMKLKNHLIGEIYEAVYDSSNLKNARLDYSKPILDYFQKDTIYQVTILNEGIKPHNVTVTFEYEVKSKKYTRKQYLPRDEEWHKINTFCVIYDIDNPQIAYLFPI